MSRAVRDERGSATELALAAPLMVMMLLLPVLASRVSEARAEVDGAARAAARAAAVARSAQEAPAAAETAARDELALAGLSCTRVAVSTDTARFHPGQPGRSAGSVRVQVTCTVDLGDVALLGVPGSKALTASFVAPVDAMRGRR